MSGEGDEKNGTADSNEKGETEKGTRGDEKDDEADNVELWGSLPKGAPALPSPTAMRCESDAAAAALHDSDTLESFETYP